MIAHMLAAAAALAAGGAGGRPAVAATAQTVPAAERRAHDGTHIPAFDSRAVRRARPFVLTTPARVELARRRIKDPAYAGVFDALAREAQAALDLRLEPFATQWWETIRDKPWAETYAPIFEHTWLEPGRFATPLEALAHYGVITADRRSLEKARQILVHLAGFSFEPEHYDVGMNYSVWGVRALRAYELLHDEMSAAERARLDDFFTRLGRAVLRNDAYWVENRVGGGINNHLAWHKMMLGLLGLFYEQEELVQYALRGPRGLVELLELGLVDDGLWCEGSLVYHFAAVGPMVVFADALRNAGHPFDLYTAVLADGRTLRQPLEAMFGVLLPDRVIPPVGDTYGARARLADNPIYEYAWGAYGDVRYAWLLRRAGRRHVEALFSPPLPDKADGPAVGTRLYPEHGYAFLRSAGGPGYWEGEGWCAMLTYDRSGVHSHADKLSLMLFGAGRLVVPDVEATTGAPHAFSSRVQNELNRGGLSHNTVMIDGGDQRAAGERLELIEFRDLPTEKRVTAADRRGLLYEGVRQQRTVCVTGEYVLDVFQVDCDRPRQIDWVVHVLDSGAQRVSGPLMRACPPAGRGAPWAWLRDFRCAGVDGRWEAEWSGGDGVSVRLSMAGCPGTTVFECGYPASDQPGAGCVPMLLVRRTAARTAFAAVWTVGLGAASSASIEARADCDGYLTFGVRCGDIEREHRVPQQSARP